jgi:SAM-dependent methyltransferase
MVIGLSLGAWAQVIANNPQVERVTVVEINPGYLRLIPKYPAVASVLHNPKVSIEIDDGRRWLVRNPSAKFDVIVSNTTFNWRAHITNLLSREFLEIVRKHLKPGGVFFYNTTSSGEVQRTGVAVFPYGALVGTCLALSDSPISLDIDRWKRVISDYRIDGVPVLDQRIPAHKKRLEELVALYSASENAESIRNRTRDGIGGEPSLRPRRRARFEASGSTIPGPASAEASPPRRAGDGTERRSYRPANDLRGARQARKPSS